MKKRHWIRTYISLLLSLVSIIAAFSYIGLEKILSIDWDIIAWISLAITVFVLLSVVITSLLMMRHHRILSIYISAPLSYDKEVSKLKDALDGENIVSVDDIKPGTSVNDLSRVIKKSNFCFFAVGKTQSPMQKEELKVMKGLGKKFYVVSMDESGKLPQVLRDEVPLYINDVDFDHKVKSILLEYK